MIIFFFKKLIHINLDIGFLVNQNCAWLLLLQTKKFPSQQKVSSQCNSNLQ